MFMLKFLIAIFLLICPNLVFAEWDVNIPLAADNLTDFPVDNQENLDRLELVLKEYPKGITLSYSSGSTIVASTGGIVCSDATGVTKKFRGNTSTTNITFSDIDTGAEASSTTYYVYANCDAVATTATFKISLSSTTPTGLTSYKRIGSFYNDSSSNITNIDNDDITTSELNQWSSKTLGVTYQALTDGFVVAYTTVTEDFYVWTLYTDSSSSPTTVRANMGTNSTTTAVYTSMMSPIKRGDYYKVVQSGSGDQGSASMYFIPLGT